MAFESSNEPSLLITGFEPFGGELFNPSEWILEKIKSDSTLSKFCETLTLPVAFDEAHLPVLQALKSKTYRAWIGFGQAGGRSKIGLERVALNWKETEIADNKGIRPQPDYLEVQGPRALFSVGPLESMRDKLIRLQIPVEISFSAGAYVCNSVYYHVLNHLPSSMWGLFVHVPLLQRQVLNKPGKPYLTEEELWQAVQILLQKAISFKA